MKWSRERLRMADQLNRIDVARRRAADARLAAARGALKQAEETRDEARVALEQSELAWATHLGSAFDIDLGRALGAELNARDDALIASEERRLRADQRLSHEQVQWRTVEAIVRSGKAALRSGRKTLRRRADEARDCELADRTSWTWYIR